MDRCTVQCSGEESMMVSCSHLNVCTSWSPSSFPLHFLSCGPTCFDCWVDPITSSNFRQIQNYFYLKNFEFRASSWRKLDDVTRSCTAHHNYQFGSSNTNSNSIFMGLSSVGIFHIYTSKSHAGLSPAFLCRLCCKFPKKYFQGISLHKQFFSIFYGTRLAKPHESEKKTSSGMNAYRKILVRRPGTRGFCLMITKPFQRLIFILLETTLLVVLGDDVIHLSNIQTDSYITDADTIGRHGLWLALLSVHWPLLIHFGHLVNVQSFG